MLSIRKDNPLYFGLATRYFRYHFTTMHQKLTSPFEGLNWKEIETLAMLARGALGLNRASGAESRFRVTGVVVPERADFPGGCLKNEWALRLASRSHECSLLWSIQPQLTYFFITHAKVRAAASATHSPFSLRCASVLRGLSLESLEALPRERALLIWFSGGIGLFLFLIPTRPEAFLIQKSDSDIEILARSRANSKTDLNLGKLIFPDGKKSPDNIDIRDFFKISSANEFEARANAFFLNLAFERRLLQIEHALREQTAHHQALLKKSKTRLEQAVSERDWKTEAQTLKASLQSQNDAGTISEMEKLFAKAKRKARRIEEGQGLIEETEAKLSRLQGFSAKCDELDDGDFASLIKIEEPLGLGPSSSDSKNLLPKSLHPWPGRQFKSKEGLTILVGKSRDENRDLTFKYARGNDMWLHVRGRPGAHVIIVLPAKRSASLETLLDAATLAIYFSSGKDWGKTEVTYTFRKFVKSIKDSTEVRYSQDKTLTVEVDARRLERLLV